MGEPIGFVSDSYALSMSLFAIDNDGARTLFSGWSTTLLAENKNIINNNNKEQQLQQRGMTHIIAKRQDLTTVSISAIFWLEIKNMFCF